MPDGGIDALRLAYRINEAPYEATASVTDDALPPTTSSAPTMASMPRRTQKLSTARVYRDKRPICECLRVDVRASSRVRGVDTFCGVNQWPDAPVEASRGTICDKGVLRYLPPHRAVRSRCQFNGDRLGRLVASPSLRRAYFFDEALGFDVRPLNAFALPIAIFLSTHAPSPT